MASVVARAAQEYVKQSTPEQWLLAAEDGCLKVDLSKVPACIQDAVKNVLCLLRLDDPAFRNEMEKTRNESGVEVPRFADVIGGEQHTHYMLPYLMRTPPLLALMLAASGHAVADHVSMTDAHYLYRNFLAAIAFKREQLLPMDGDRVTQAAKKYNQYILEAEDWMAGMLPKMPMFKELVSMTPKSGDEMDQLPPVGHLMNLEAVQTFGKAHASLTATFVSIAEMSILHTLGVRPAAAKAAKLIGDDPDHAAILDTVSMPTNYRAIISAQEMSFRTQLHPHSVNCLSGAKPLNGDAAFIAGVSAEFVFLNYALMCMGVSR